MQLVKEFYKLMHDEFEMSLMRDLNYFLGLQIKQLKEGTFVCQAKYCHELLKRFEMIDSKSIDTLMSTNGNLERDEHGKHVDIKMYRSMTRYFEYPIVSRPAIMFSVCMCARYQLAPQESHLKAVKRILRYLYDTSKYRLWFSKGINCSLVGYSDSDFLGCKLDRKSTSGTSHFFLNSLVSWHNKKQFSVASSTS
ncbi:secreted RxLR effector protein 161-like [Lathyrus oleraceus]|uniref:secreted RxLR effector protein 161-like n=1 Tax=Pisum sativum TaxID=3888 RepID=UPI0021D397DF|nr:secreted RxLR effector protein 161-like [Pisum sativum]